MVNDSDDGFQDASLADLLRIPRDQWPKPKPKLTAEDVERLVALQEPQPRLGEDVDLWEREARERSEDAIRRQSARKKGCKRLFITRAGSREPQPIKWLSRPLLPLGKLAILSADGGTGKSSIVRAIMGHILRGEGILAPEDGPAEILVCLAEDSLDEQYIPALLAEGCTREQIDRVHWVFGVGDGEEPDGEFSAEHIPQVEEELKRNPAIKLVIIDPLASLVANAGLKMDGQEGARQSSGKLHSLAKKLNISVLQLAHEVKSKEATGAHKLAGSHQHSASSRHYMQLKKHTGGGVYLKMVKGNLPKKSIAETVLFKQVFIGREKAIEALEREGYDVEKFIGDTPEQDDNWDAFHFQEVTTIPTPASDLELTMEDMDIQPTKSDRRAKEKVEGVQRLQVEIVNHLKRIMQPIRETELVTIMSSRFGHPDRWVRDAISMVLAVPGTSVKRLRSGKSHASEIAYIVQNTDEVQQ